jgi:indolepyruvate ferredoxin oxidoreductase beta subunit
MAMAAGGVLVDWIVDLAEHAGWTAQATSVAGVAQRTGATVYFYRGVAAADRPRAAAGAFADAPGASTSSSAPN